MNELGMGLDELGWAEGRVCGFDMVGVLFEMEVGLG